MQVIQQFICALQTNTDPAIQALVIVITAMIGALVAFVRTLYAEIVAGRFRARLFAGLMVDLIGASAFSFILVPALVRQEFALPAAFLIGFLSSRLLRSAIDKVVETTKDDGTVKDKK